MLDGPQHFCSALFGPGPDDQGVTFEGLLDLRQVFGFFCRKSRDDAPDFPGYFAQLARIFLLSAGRFLKRFRLLRFLRYLVPPLLMQLLAA